MSHRVRASSVASTRSSTRRTQRLAAFVVAVAGLASSVFGQISESVGDRVVRFFVDEPAKQAALPSYAFEPQLSVTGAAPANFPVAVAFSTDAEGKQVARIDAPPGTSFYGTGSVVGPLLRNGRTAVLWNTDAYGYDDSTLSLYQSHPYVLALRPDGTAFGVIADSTYRMTIQTGPVSAPNSIIFIAEGPQFPVVIIERPSPQEVVKELARLTGYMPMPPKWAVGYHQCRYSYYPEAWVHEIATTFRQKKIPCDVIWFDIHYMDNFRIFSFDKQHFPNPARLNRQLLDMGFHNVWMINPGVKIEDGTGVTEVFDSGNANDVWVKRADGSVYRGEVWPGWCHFPDFTDPKVRAWWGPFYTPFIEQSITGVWNDMNEPAIFNVTSKTMPEDNRHRGDPSLITPSGKPQGEKAAGDHARYHNVYGMTMIKGSREGIQAAAPERRPFVLSRASYLGGQRYGAMWSGDNTANWYHLEASVPMALNMGLSGQPFAGPDIGGFIGDGDAQMFARWMSVGAMLPFARGHTGNDTRNKQPWSFGPEVEEICRRAITRRYILMPYFYSLFREAAVTGLPVSRPLFFADPTDPALRSEDDAFLVGPDLLISPQLVPQANRTPVMPKGIWQEFHFNDSHPDLPRMFLRGGGIVPSGPIIQYVNEKPLDPLTLLVALDSAGNATGQLYEDAGDGFGYRNGEFLLTTYSAKKEGNTVTVSVAKSEGKNARPSRSVVVRLLHGGKEFTATGTDGQPVKITLP